VALTGIGIDEGEGAMETTASGGEGLPAAAVAAVEPVAAADPAAAAEPADRLDVSAAFDMAGPEEAPRIVFLHGTRVTRAMWDPQVAALTDRYRVVTVDLPGHGVFADMPFRMPLAVSIVRSVIDRAGGRAIVVGQSLGGYVAMELATAYPGHVAGLVLCNSTAEPRTVARRAPRTVGVYLADRVSERYLGRGAPVQASGPVSGPAPRATNGWLFKGGYRAVVTALRTSFLPQLAAYPGPVLLVNGADDPIFRRAELTFLAACGDGRLRVIEGAGHLVSSEQPEAFNAAIRQFAEVVFTTPASQ
jgi:pimeloyl-ACP methyl ester carboxylesterase